MEKVGLIFENYILSINIVIFRAKEFVSTEDALVDNIGCNV